MRELGIASRGVKRGEGKGLRQENPNGEMMNTGGVKFLMTLLLNESLRASSFFWHIF